jgi:hypothetical protein
MTALIAAFLWLALLQSVSAATDPLRVDDVYKAPYIDNGHDVQFFILEASFPYNAPDNIR